MKSRAAPYVKPQYLRIALLGTLGVLLLLWGTFYGTSGQGRDIAKTAGGLTQEEESISRMVEDALAFVQGVGRVQVRVTLEMGPESVYARNTTVSKTSQVETSADGERRENTTSNESSQPVTGRFGGVDEPLVERVAPVKIGGCLVVAEGAASSRVKLAIYKAVSTLLKAPMYKIVVEPMKGVK